MKLKNNFFFLFILLVITNTTCGKPKFKKTVTYNIRSNEMTLELPYDLVSADGNIYKMYSSTKPDSWIQVSAGGKMGIGSLSENYDISFTPFDPSFPDYDCYEYGTDPSSTIVWAIRGRGLYVFDYDTKKTYHRAFNDDINSELYFVQLIDPTKKILLITLGHSKIDLSNQNIWSHHVFDILNDTLLFETQQQNRLCYKFGKNTMLTIGNSIWEYSDATLSKLPDNTLIRKLTAAFVDFNDHESIHNNFAIGTLKQDEQSFDDIPCTVEWNDDLSDASVKPIIVQVPSGFKLRIPFAFSPDGTWLRGWCKKAQKGGDEWLLFYHIDSKYPQHLSLPVLGGGSKMKTNGCFVNHSKLGPLYIQNEPDGSAIRVYQISKIPGILSDAMLKSK